MIESLYVIDSSGLCLFSSPLMPTKQFEPNIICGFIVAQQQYFQDAFGESTRKFTLEKKEIQIQTVELSNRNVVLAIAYSVGNEREEKFSKIILDSLVKALRNKEKIFRGLSEGVTRVFEEELAQTVEKTLESISCPHLVKGFLGITNHCEKTDSPIADNRPCDFNYAVRQCDRYTSRVSEAA